MSDLINERRHTRDWLSSGKIKLIITVSEREMLKTFGDRSCRMAAPRPWNAFPSNISLLRTQF